MVDCMRFPVIDAGTATVVPGAPPTVTAAPNQIYSAQRLQPYRGGHLVRSDTTPPSGLPVTGPARTVTTICPPSPPLCLWFFRADGNPRPGGNPRRSLPFGERQRGHHGRVPGFDQRAHQFDPGRELEPHPDQRPRLLQRGRIAPRPGLPARPVHQAVRRGAISRQHLRERHDLPHPGDHGHGHRRSRPHHGRPLAHRRHGSPRGQQPESVALGAAELQYGHRQYAGQPLVPLPVRQFLLHGGGGRPTQQRRAGWQLHGPDHRDRRVDGRRLAQDARILRGPQFRQWGPGQRRQRDQLRLGPGRPQARPAQPEPDHRRGGVRRPDRRPEDQRGPGLQHLVDPGRRH